MDTLIVQVDEQGKAVRPVRYSAAHDKTKKQGIRHLSSNTIIFEDPSYTRLLVIKRAAQINGGNKYDFYSGGHAEWLDTWDRAMSPLETALMEVRQELFHRQELPRGFSNTIQHITEFPKDLRQYDREWVHIYRAVCPGPFFPDPEEVAGCNFMSLDELSHQLLAHPEQFTMSAQLYHKKYFEAVRQGSRKK